MNRKLWLRMMALSVALSVPTTSVLRAQPTPGTEAETAAQAAERDFNLLQQRLNDSRLPQEARNEAARRIVQFYMAPRHDDATRVLQEALDSPNAGVQLAAARGLEVVSEPEEAFILPLSRLLGRNTNATQADAVSRALAKYSSAAAINYLVQFAQDSGNLEQARATTIRALGRMNQKAAAQALIQLLGDDTNTPVIQDAILDALAEMTSLDFARDVARWQDWWSRNKALPEDQWQLEQFQRRVAQAARQERDKTELEQQLAPTISYLFQYIPEAQREDAIMNLLKSPAPAIRASGSERVREQITNSLQPLSDKMKAQLRNMVGDSAAVVRKEVAQTVGLLLDDPAAIDALLAQLQVESDSDVRAAITRALGPAHDLRALPTLLTLLKDPSLDVSEAAAQALATEKMSDEIRKDPQKVADTAAALKQALQRTQATIGGQRLRVAIAQAMASLRTPALLDDLYMLKQTSNPQNDARVRRAAVAGLGSVINPPDKAAVATALVFSLRGDPSPGVRLEAVRAIGRMGSFAQVNELYVRLGAPAGPPEDPAVSSAALTVLLTLCNGPDATPDDLRDLINRMQKDFPKDLESRLTLYEKALLPKIEGNAELEAPVQQDIAQILFQQGRFSQAAIWFDKALKTRRDHRALPAVIEPLAKQEMEAMLRAKSYRDAIVLAQDLIHGTDHHMEEMIGQEIWNESGRLYAAGDLAGVLKLIEETQKLTPPLGGRYAEMLKTLEQTVRSKLPPS